MEKSRTKKEPQKVRVELEETGASLNQQRLVSQTGKQKQKKNKGKLLFGTDISRGDRTKKTRTEAKARYKNRVWLFSSRPCLKITQQETLFLPSLLLPLLPPPFSIFTQGKNIVCIYFASSFSLSPLDARLAFRRVLKDARQKEEGILLKTLAQQ